jgi:hypothetical protein
MTASEITELINRGMSPKEIDAVSQPNLEAKSPEIRQAAPVGDDLAGFASPASSRTTSSVEQPVPLPPSNKDAEYYDPDVDSNTLYQAFDYPTPAHVLVAFSRHILTGEVSLWDWQRDCLLELAPTEKPTSKHPLKYFLIAANGSGKDAFVISPFAIWFILTKIQAQVIVTSSSGTQLTAQTESYIKSLAESINQKMGGGIFKIRQRYIRCLKSGSVIRMFATDEPGKAEGYHPLTPNAEMAIIKNESKSIPEDIHQALRRCSGFNYWLEVSSPGSKSGAFYRAATTWVKGRRVTSFDCPHISDDEREADKIELGEDSSTYRSKHLALFTDSTDEVVITSTSIENLLVNPPSFQFVSWPKRVGFDIAAGGDENSVHITQGVKILAQLHWTEKDTTISAQKFHRFMIDNSISKDHEFIFADDGGVGHAVIDLLNNEKFYGYSIKRTNNQSAPYNRKRFGNRGAEMWFHVKRIIEESMFDLRGISSLCKDQLCTRKYKQQEGGRLFLQSKRAAKADGAKSPDRADSFVLAFSGLTVEDFLNEAKFKVVEQPRVKRLSSGSEVEDYYDGITFERYDMQQNGSPVNRNKMKRISLDQALGLHNKEISFNS